MTKAEKKLRTFRVAKSNLIATLLCLAFLLICFNYSLKINLWGDEAYSLLLVEKSWQQIFTNFDVHLPTYYFFLKILVSIFGDSNELLLRLLHSILFSVGLFFGYKTILFLSKSSKKSLLVLLSAIVSPTFVFYATNLRMYPILFLLSMFYIFRLSQIILKNELLTKKDWTIYLIAASCLIIIDYPGIIVFLIGTGLLFFKFLKLRLPKYILLALSPILSLLIYYFHLLPEIKGILAWKTTISSQIGVNYTSLFDFAKWVYSAFRPVFDLFSSSQKNILLALVFPVVFASGLFLSLSLFLVKRKKKAALNIFIVSCFAFYWLIAIFSSHALTRVFLPALFFMPAFLILANPYLPKIIVKFNMILFSLLLLTNFFQVLNPTLNLYSSVPYKTISADSAEIAKREEIENIYFSDNSLNNQSIKRYLEKSGSSLKISMVSSDFKSDSLTKGDFIFVSHMGENNNFVDYHKFPKDYQVTNIKNYIKLAAMPYNPFWKKQITDKAFQEYAVSIYLVKVK